MLFGIFIILKGNFLSVHHNGAGICPVNPGKNVHKGGFACPILPHQRMYFAGTDMKIDPAQDLVGAKGFADAYHINIHVLSDTSLRR